MWSYETGSAVGQWAIRVGGKAAFILATTSMVVLMPLLFEITREGQVCFCAQADEYVGDGCTSFAGDAFYPSIKPNLTNPSSTPLVYPCSFTAVGNGTFGSQ